MAFKKMLVSTAALSMMFAGTAYAQSEVDLSQSQIRIEVNDCPFGTCINMENMSGAEATAAIQTLIAAREAALAEGPGASGSASSNSNGSGNNNGRGNALGQQDNSPQLVYLEFNPGEPTFEVFIGGAPFAGGVFPDYIYTEDDRDFIQERLEADYAAYNYEFTQTKPTSGDFTTLSFGDNDGNPIDLAGGILFGAADNIDFGNDDRSDNAFIDASFWQLLAELDANFGTQNLMTFLALPAPLVLGEVETFRQIAVVNQSANTGSHELGHIQGLRHHDAFGAPGTGLPLARDPGEFIPATDVSVEGLETLQHIMASGASAGLALESPPFVDRFFGERSAVKLALNGRTRIIEESTAEVTGGQLDLKRVVSPNPVLEGVNSGSRLDIEAVLVKGNVSDFDDVDTFDFRGDEGAVFNAEIISFSDSNIADPVIAELELSLRQSDGSFVVVAENAQTFEPFDPLIFDFTLPARGDYRLSVKGQQFVTLGDGTVLDLTVVAPGLLSGDYDLLAYVVEGGNGNGQGPSRLPGPRN